MASFTDWVSKYLDSEFVWISEIFLVVFATLFVASVLGWIIDRAIHKASKTKTLWDDALLGTLRKPLQLLIWLVGISFAASLSEDVLDSQWLQAIMVIREVGAVIIVTYFLNSFISRAEKNMVSAQFLSKPMDKTTAIAIGKLLRVAVIITAVLVVIQSMGYSISGVLAIGGIGGIAVG